MGAVWKALDEKLGDEVVLKLPLNHYDSEIIKRFDQEAKTMRTHSLECPHILNIEDIGRLEEVPWYVMRFLPGGSVRDQVVELDDAGNFTWENESFEWLKQIASALDYLHDRDTFHRDVKPENILFSGEGTPYLVDFGIVKTVNETTSMMTDQGAAVGTMAYMAPETLEGAPFTAQSDQYSLAVTLYEYITGEKPYSGTTFFTLFKSLQSGHRKLSTLFPALPILASDSVDRALSAESSLRFKSCKEFSQAFLKGLESGDRCPESTQSEQDPPSSAVEEQTRELDMETYRKSVPSQSESDSAKPLLRPNSPVQPGSAKLVFQTPHKENPVSPTLPVPKKRKRGFLPGALTIITVLLFIAGAAVFAAVSLNRNHSGLTAQKEYRNTEVQRAQTAERNRLAKQRKQLEAEREEASVQARLMAKREESLRKEKVLLEASKKKEEQRRAAEKLAADKLAAEKLAADRRAAENLAADKERAKIKRSRPTVSVNSKKPQLLVAPFGQKEIDAAIAAVRRSEGMRQILKNGQATKLEAENILNTLGAVKIFQRDQHSVSGDFGSNQEVTLWVGTFGKSDRYGVRYGGNDGRYWGSNDTYFEITR